MITTCQRLYGGANHSFTVSSPKGYESLVSHPTGATILRSCWTCLPKMVKLQDILFGTPFRMMKPQPAFAQAIRVRTFRVNRHNKRRGIQPAFGKAYFATAFAGVNYIPSEGN